MPRYAVLRDLDDPELRPAGLVVERSDRVNLLLLDDFGLKTEFREPYNVTEPDGGSVAYYPGEPRYFDHALVTLSRMFLVGKIEPVETLDVPTIREIFFAEVVAHQPRPAAVKYEVEPDAVSARHRTAAPTGEGPEETEPRASLLAAA